MRKIWITAFALLLAASVQAAEVGGVKLSDKLAVAGQELVLNGTDKGAIAGDAFNRALTRIWLGDNPVQADLKKAMLGG